MVARAALSVLIPLLPLSFQQKQIESILRRYIREYVTCHTCRSPNTFLAKRNRLYFLQCEVS